MSTAGCVCGRLWRRSHAEPTGTFSLGLGELEALARLISPFISPPGMFEPAGQGSKSARLGGNSRLAGEAWPRAGAHVCALRLPPAQLPQDEAVRRFHARFPF